jgi:hypothetical protein
MIEGSGSISLTNGSGFGSGRPTNIKIQRIRIRIRNTGTNNAGIASAEQNHHCESAAGGGTPATAKAFAHHQTRLQYSKVASHNMDASIGSGASKIRYDGSRYALATVGSKITNYGN